MGGDLLFGGGVYCEGKVEGALVHEAWVERADRQPLVLVPDWDHGAAYGGCVPHPWTDDY